MKGMPFNLQGKGVLELVELEKDGFWYGGAGAGDGGGGGAVKKRKQREFEPRSVLDHRSPSPPTSTSTLSSSLGGGGGGGSSDNAGVAAVSDTPAAPARKWPSSSPTADRREEWPADLQTIPAGALDASQRGAAAVSGGGPLAVEDWETMLSEPAASPGQEQTFLRWIMGDIDDPSSGLKPPAPAQLSQGPGDFDASAASFGFGFGDAGGFGFEPLHGIGVAAPAINPSLFSGPSTASFSSAPSQNQLPAPMPSIKVPSFGPNPAFPPPAAPLPLPPGMLFQESMEEKPQLFAPSLLQSHATQNHPAFFFPEPHHQLLLPPHPKRHHPMDPDLFLRRNNPYPLPPPRPLKSKLAAGDEQQQQQQQALVDQLFKAAELIEAGNSGGARGILARLNHQLPPSPPLGKPLLRSASYFRDALQLLLSASPPPSSSSSLSSPLDVVLKLSAYKAFSDVSPVLQFTNFTSIQALLEELAGSDRIHVIDFDIGVGGQWSSFMQELAQRRCAAGTTSPVLKITAFISPTAAHHPLELHLTRENLSHFAADLNIAFEFNAVSLDSFDPVSILAMSQGDAFAVNLPVGSAFGAPIPAILRLVKQLSPKIVISVDHGCDRSDLPFSHHFLHALQSGMVLLDSIDAAGANHEIANKIERFLLQPRIENSVLGRHRAAEKLLPWRTLFASTGFVPLQFSNFTETQAECLLKRVQVRGFHVEKRQASLFLYWQRGELVSVSAWRC